MWATVTMGELISLMALFALILAVATAIVGAIVVWMRGNLALKRGLAALYAEVELNTAALERWGFDAARARRDSLPAAFAPRKAVFQSISALLPRTPRPTLEKVLDFYTALETLERMSIQATLNTPPADAGEAFLALKPTAEQAATLGRRALFSFSIEGAVPAMAPLRTAKVSTLNTPAELARAAGPSREFPRAA